MSPRTPVFVLLLLSMALGLAGCSYFNAFYNTKRSFNEAETARERSTNLDARPAEYNEAVESGARLIEMYPESKFIDDALYLMGQSYYWLGDYHKARRKFEELLSNYPDSPFVQESRMWLGKVHVQLRKSQEATSLLRGLIADTDDPHLVSESRFALAELYYVDSLFVKAAEEFAKIPDIAVDDELTGMSYWRAGECLFHEGRYAESEPYLEQALEYDLVPAVEFKVQLVHGQALTLAGDPEAGLDIFNDLLKDKRYFQNHGVVRVQKGVALARLGRLEEAFEEWDRTITDHPRSDEAAQAFYQMGLVHLERPGERELAKEMFDKSRTEKARSLYSLKADTLLNQLERVDQLALDRAVLKDRIDYTEIWITNPISPRDTLAFTSAAFYDSLAIDSLKLAPLWLTAWRDSVITLEPDSTALDSSMFASTDTTEAALQESAETNSLASVPIDTLAGAPNPTLDPFAEYADRSPHRSAAADTAAVPAPSIVPPEGMHESVQLPGMATDDSPDSLAVDSSMTEAVAEIPPEADPLPGEPLAKPDSTLLNPPDLSDPFAQESPMGQDQELRDEWERMLAEREESGADPMGDDDLRQAWEQMLASRDREMEPSPSDSTASPADSAAPPPVRTETITLFDTAPVLDSLGQMRADLQETRFQLGEIQLFDLLQPDSARLIFRELADPPNVDSVRARALTVLAFIEREENDSTASDSILHRIAREFPTTRAGRAVIEDLGLTMEEPVTPAEEAYREAESLFLDDDNPQDAYSRYRWIASTYTSTEWAPRSMYAAAYIAGVHLDDGETAEELFNTLSEEYPESPQAQRARQKISAYDAIRFASNTADTTDIATEFADIDAYSEEDVESIAEIIGGVETLASTLDARNLLPQEVIQGTGGEVLLRFVVYPDKHADNFRIVMEDPPGSGLGRALVAGLEEVQFYPARREGEPVATKVERRYTLPLDAPPNVRPLPKR